MNRVGRKELAAVFVVLSIPAFASAQAVGSALAGVVKDSSGAAIPGVTVEAASSALIEKTRSVVTDQQGQYKIVDLRPGTYSVTFTLVGFASLKREGIELSANFTADVNAELHVGNLEETVTVSGAAPMVDIQNVTQQKSLNREVIDSTPIAKGMLGFAALMPSVIIPPDAQDVGGGAGETSVRMALHGGKQSDQKLLLDGMRYNTLATQGTGRGYYVNPGATQEVVIELGAGGSAEFATGGVQVDAIPKDGANRFSGFFFSNYAGNGFQSDNLTPDLQASGLKSVNKVEDIYDVNGSFGGPVLKDRLWFYTSIRRFGETTDVANLFHNGSASPFAYVPNQVAGSAQQKNQSNYLRLTWQARPKQKITLLADYQNNCECQRNLTAGGIAWEASPVYERLPDAVYQATWTYAVTDKFLLSAGINVTPYVLHVGLQDGVTASSISILEQSTSFTYSAPTSFGRQHLGNENQKLSASYVTGSHNIKVGFFAMEGSSIVLTNRSAPNVSYTFSGGTPISLTEYAAPLATDEALRPELAVYGQDQWTLKRMTLNAGLRFEYLRAFVPPSQQVAGLFVPARSFPQVDCVPCWKDLSPRFGVSYDLFGTGKTAVKFSLGRYTAAETTTTAGTYDPVNASVNSVSRAWTDSNHNFVPDCNLQDPLLNAECAQISNLNFGGSNVTTHADPAVLTGWGHRPYQWQTSVAIEQELRPGLAMSGGYYRTWYGNFTVTDNLSVTPADYDPYCIKAPTDPRLPGGGGNQICGLYDINPLKFGQVNNLVTFASNFGRQTEIYNGVDLNVNARLKRGVVLSGGVSVGDEISTSQGLGVSQSATNNCFVVDSPQQLYQCNVHPSYRANFKVFGVYPLPWLGLQASANFQSLPGAPIAASYSVPTAQIAPSLGRNLAGNTKTATIALITPYTEYDPRISQLDLRLTKSVRVGSVRVQGMFDLYNALNASTILALNTTYGSAWLRPLSILNGRIAKLGVQFEF